MQIIGVGQSSIHKHYYISCRAPWPCSQRFKNMTTTQAWSIITPAVLFITNDSQVHIQPTERMKTAVRHSNGSIILYFVTSCFNLPLETIWNLFQAVFNHNYVFHDLLCWTRNLLLTALSHTRVCKGTSPAGWCFDNCAVQQHLVTIELWKH